ncbi:hypothetical protein GE09DRAFT_64404 [Coniochaeta sp. 2T2.1]|nr:hypothetical protein GE09DRAFT_64404 [Coniochaeta sp. 2T2.1]
MRITLSLVVASAAVACVADLASLPSFLRDVASKSFPRLKNIAVDIYNHPELGLAEHRAHDAIVRHFASVDGWKVTPHAYGMETSFSLVYEHRPAGFDGQLKTIGVIAEYDALVIGHACGHNHIALNAITVASLASQALVKYNIPGRIVVLGCPDEENMAAKFQLYNRGAFDPAEIWIMAHPTSSSAFQPMNARLNSFARFTGKTHQEAVKKAYNAMVTVKGLSGKLPGTSSTAASILNVGVYAVNVVQQNIGIGISGSDIATVKKTVSPLLTSAFQNVTYVVGQDADGVAINITGPGGHASETTQGALDFSVRIFQALSDNPSIGFYLPGNTTSKELDITVDMRTRYTQDLPSVAATVDAAIGGLSSGISHDIQYPALEVTPYLPQTIIDLLATPEYNLTDWKMSEFAPAASDASWAQSAVVDLKTHELLSVGKVVVHANYRICNTAAGSLCGFNHEPNFAIVAGSEYSYTQTEIVARALSQIVTELLADEDMYGKATAIIRN